MSEYSQDERPGYGRFITIILYAILVIPAIVFALGWYFRLSPQGKRKFWVVVVALAILGWLWQLLLQSPIFTKTEQIGLLGRL